MNSSGFLANMSHELLYAIIGFSEVLPNRMFGDGLPPDAVVLIRQERLCLLP